MRIKKVFNNNVVSSLDESDDEVILVGTGIGFQKKPGDIIRLANVEKVFKLENKNLQQEFLLKVCNISYDHLKASNEIVDKISERLDIPVSAAFYATMADHISFTIARYHNKQNFRNLLAEEIQRFYPAEYQMGLEAVAHLNKTLCIELPIDEAASIAVHIVNLSFALHMSFTMRVVKSIADIMDIVAQSAGIPIGEAVPGYGGFITYIKYILQKANKKQYVPDKQIALYAFLQQEYAAECLCAQKISAYLQQQYDYTLSNDQLCYLCIHLRQITT